MFLNIFSSGAVLETLGPTMSGKPSLVYKILKEADGMFQKPPERRPVLVYQFVGRCTVYLCCE
jgi:hypothetical protein